MTSNQYGVEIDKLLQNKNPDYHNGLKNILSDYQQELISKGIIPDGTYQSYAGLLKQISTEEKPELSIAYDLKESLEGLGNGISKIMPSIESSLIAKNYLNPDNSKDFIFNQKISELVQNGQEMDRSIFARTLLEVYDEKDFELPLVKLKFFRFLDPKSDFIVYSYIGRPNPK
ncbi:hypothetical protein [Allomuricauda sp. d1]|uniref:hypothetical protein n=1 Tax=Allomuricauda sp. d1 TaxID=3136725 RepID=UPI0031DC648E